MPWKPIARKCKQKSTGKTGSHVVVKVKKGGGTEQESCHTSKEKAQAAIRARYANETDVNEEEVLREWVRFVLRESAADIVSLGLRIKIPDASSLEDIYTDIRGLKNVITVRQQGEQDDIPGPMRFVNIFVTFEDDEGRDVYNLKKDIESLDDVQGVEMKNYEGQRWADVKKSYTGGRASQRKVSELKSRRPRIQESVTLNVNGEPITVELANTDDKRAIGLSGRKSLGADEGMLFQFDSPKNQYFWMKDTYIPLSIAFIDETNSITAIKSMEPLSEKSVCSDGPALYALEMPEGWFQKMNVSVGDKVRVGA